MGINYLAVLVCGVASMIVGALWYSPILFGKMWMKEHGYTEEDLKKNFNPGLTYGFTFLLHLVVAFVLALIIEKTGITNIGDGLFIGLIVWIGFTAAPMVINSMFAKKSTNLVVIDSGHHLAQVLVFAVILTLWQ